MAKQSLIISETLQKLVFTERKANLNVKNLMDRMILLFDYIISVHY